MANTTVYPYGQGGTLPTGYPIADDLNTDSAQQALSAKQGKVLRDRIFVRDVVFWQNSYSAAWQNGNFYNGKIVTNYNNQYIVISGFPEGVTEIKITRTAPDTTYSLNVYGSSDGTNFTTLSGFGTSNGTKTYTLGSYDYIAFLLWDKPTTARARQESITISYETESEVLTEMDVIDNLSSQSTTSPLSANQGRVLDGKISDLRGPEVFYNLVWITGNVDSSTGAITDYANKCTEAYYPISTSVIKVHNPTIYTVKVSCYDSSYGYLGNASSGTSISATVTQVTPQSNTAYVRFTVWDKPSDSDVANISVGYDNEDTMASLRQAIDTGGSGGGVGTYSNPVLNLDLPDPCVIYGENGYYYMYCTGQIASRKMYRTTNFIDWEEADVPITATGLSDSYTALGVSASWGFWAAEIVKIGDKYNLYCSKQASPMVVFQSDHPYFGYEFKNIIINASNGLSTDNIDACVRYDLDGTLWIFWGSTQGMYRQKLTSNGLALDTTDTKSHVAGKTSAQDSTRATVFEGAYLYRRKGYWYLFVSAGLYSNSTYCLKVGRCATLSGTFVDKDGNDMAAGNATTILSTPNGGTLYGPGHNGEIITDNDNRTFMLYHSHYTAMSSSSQRCVCLQEIFWDEDGWPYFGNGGIPQLSGNVKPNF